MIHGSRRMANVLPRCADVALTAGRSLALGLVAAGTEELEARDVSECADPDCADGHDAIDPIGGQAVLEGVMMRGKNSWGLAVRRPSGGISCHSFPLVPLARRYPVLKTPVVRGVGVLVESLTLGIRALRLSADYSLEDQTTAEPGSGEPAEGAAEPPSLGWKELAITFTVAILFAVGLFVVIPLAVVKYFEATFSNPFVFNLVEGLIRIAIFLAYVSLISFLPDLRRVFEYHGAEHKTIHAYEHGEPLDVEHVTRFSTRHPRCGTAFLLVVMVIAILVFSVVGKPSLVWLVLSRLVGIPIVAGLAYEVIRYAGRHQKGRFARMVSWPGLALQRLTTREPDAAEVEVAIAVLREVLRVEAGGEPVPKGMAMVRFAEEAAG
jgi:uncharacterized protein YqhQ